MSQLNTAQIVRRFSFSEWGGTESVVWNSTRQLVDLGDQAEILATAALDQPGETTRDGIAIRRFPYFYPYFPMGEKRRLALDKKGGNPYSPGLGEALRHGRYDLYHCHAMGRIAALVRREARCNRRPYVVSFHGGCFDVPAPELAEMLKPLRGTLRYGALLDRASGLRGDPLQDAAGLLCVGYNELAPTRERYPDKLVEYLPNGVDMARFATPSPVDFRQRLQLPPQRKILLTVSRIDYQKNQAALLELLAELVRRGGDYQLVLVGPVTAAWYAEELRRRATELQLSDRLSLIPGLAPDDPALPAAYQAADVFLLPSRHEPFGIVILEAWSAGVPVVAAPVGGINHLVRNGETGLLIDPEQTGKLADAVNALTAAPDAELRQQLITAARREVEAHYTWATIARRLHDFYETVIAAHQRSNSK